jgi:hypothetical protein
MKIVRGSTLAAVTTAGLLVAMTGTASAEVAPHHHHHHHHHHHSTGRVIPSV